jgi:hypothetical protein
MVMVSELVGSIIPHPVFLSEHPAQNKPGHDIAGKEGYDITVESGNSMA